MSARSSRPLAIDLYRPLPRLARFHESKAKWRIIDGANRCGKTLAGAVELVRACLGRLDRLPDCDGTAIVLGLKRDHIAALWRKLTSPGQFMVIEDEATGKLRGIRYDEHTGGIDPSDLARRAHWKPAPPLLPPEAIRAVEWAEPQQQCPKVAMLNNGWRIYFESSMSKPRQGEHYDFAWIDEAINNVQAFYEIVRGLVDFDPAYCSRGIWTATPQTINRKLWELKEMARQGNSDVESFPIRIEENPFISDEQVTQFSSMLPSIERRVRLRGEHALEAYRLFPILDPQTYHGWRELPKDFPQWTHYLSLDPGHTRTGVILAAVPPDNSLVLIYAALAHEGGDAQTLAAAMERLIRWPVRIAIIDFRAGRSTPMGIGMTVAELYAKALVSRKVAVSMMGPLHGFYPGNDDPQVRVKAIQEALAIRSSGPWAGTARMRFWPADTQPLLDELRSTTVSPETGALPKRGKYDLLDALGYLAAFNPVWLTPIPASEEPPIYRYRRVSRTVKLAPSLEFG